MIVKPPLLLALFFITAIVGADNPLPPAKKELPIIELDYASHLSSDYKHFEVMANGESSYNDYTNERCKLSTNALATVISTLTTNGFLELHQGRMEEAVEAADDVARYPRPGFRRPLGLMGADGETVSLTVRLSGREKTVNWRMLASCIQYYPTVKELQLLQSSIAVVRTNLCPSWRGRLVSYSAAGRPTKA